MPIIYDDEVRYGESIPNLVHVRGTGHVITTACIGLYLTFLVYRQDGTLDIPISDSLNLHFPNEPESIKIAANVVRKAVQPSTTPTLWEHLDRE